MILSSHHYCGVTALQFNATIIIYIFSFPQNFPPISMTQNHLIGSSPALHSPYNLLTHPSPPTSPFPNLLLWCKQKVPNWEEEFWIPNISINSSINFFSLFLSCYILIFIFLSFTFPWFKIDFYTSAFFVSFWICFLCTATYVFGM